MPLFIVRNDITRMNVDAIVNATDTGFSGSGGGDRAIHAAAGPELARACAALGHCAVGEAKITRGYDLPSRCVIHTVGSRWDGGTYEARNGLRKCYVNSLRLAAEYGCETVAFPLISAGTLGWPAEEAMLTAKNAIGEFLEHRDMMVYIVLYNSEVYRVGGELFGSIASYIDDNYAAERYDALPRASRYERNVCAPAPCAPAPCAPAPRAPAPAEKKSGRFLKRKDKAARTEPEADAVCHDAVFSESRVDPELARYIDFMRDESFAQMLFRCIDERGMTDTECYKRANIDRKLFSKIRSDQNYRPSKTTVLAFAVSLRLDMDRTQELLRKAGYALSSSSKGDIIVRYFIERGCYDIYSINEALFSFDQRLLGS